MASRVYALSICTIFFVAGLLAAGLFAAGPAVAQTSEAWQQRIAYDMDITLRADRHQMDGTQRVTYYNNSPDTLRQIFYHLYFNAFNPESMMAERNRQLPDPDGRVVPRIFELGPDEVGYHRVQSLTQDGRALEYDITDTVLRAALARPILPGDSAVFAMRFASQVPLQTRRSGRDNREGIEFSMSQWYPKVAGYDERGWHADPYVGREFYAPFGTFDVRITAPAPYTLGGTGILVNADAIGRAYDRPGTWRPAEASIPRDDSLTWHFRARDVHDFAWAADPDYVHEHIRDGDGISYHLLYQPDVAERWEPMSDWVPALIQFFGRQYGPYAYPQFTVAQAGDGGMEYPMVNFITGRRSPGSLLGVTAHEAAHEWFYAMLGSNEADYAWMDEGFTSYATDEAVAHITGRPAQHTGAYLNVLFLKHEGLLERFNTPADWFATNAAYGTTAYSGGEMLVDMLGYVISDERRDAWLRAYYDRFRFAHPSPFDLEKLAEDVSGLQLDWYFEQFANTTRSMDYALADLEVRPDASGYRATVTLERRDDVVMPADVRLTLDDGSTHWVHVPLGIMQGHKPVPNGWSVAEPWLWTSPTYSFTVALPGRPVRAELDPAGRTPDRNRLNNSSRFPLRAHFLEPAGQSWSSYQVGYRPLLRYAHDYGMGAGLRAEGQYLFGQHRTEATLTLWPLVLASGGENPIRPWLTPLNPAFLGAAGGTWFDGVDYALSYARQAGLLGTRAELAVSAEKHLGLLENTLGLSFGLASLLDEVDATLSVDLVHQLNPTNRVFGVLSRTYQPNIACTPPFCLSLASPYTQYLNPFQREHMLSLRTRYAVTDGPDRLHLDIEAGASLRDPSSRLGTGATANRLVLDATKGANLGPFLGTARLTFGLGASNLALHKWFRLGSASYEDAWRDDAFRTTAAAFADPRGDAHLAALGSAGPVAYLLTESTSAEPVGSRLLAGTLHLSTRPFQASWLRPFRLGLFSGVGQAWSDSAFLAGLDPDDLLADAGLSVAYDVAALRPLRRWTAQSDVLSGLQLTARLPLWVSDPERITPDDEAFAFRWLLGIQTSLAR